MDRGSQQRCGGALEKRVKATNYLQKRVQWVCQYTTDGRILQLLLTHSTSIAS